jgi:hypothetical protein
LTVKQRDYVCEFLQAEVDDSCAAFRSTILAPPILPFAERQVLIATEHPTPYVTERYISVVDASAQRRRRGLSAL